MPAEWTEDSRDTPTINGNVARLDAEIASRLGHRDEFTLDLPRGWHTAIHAGCVHIPRVEYVGHYRGEPLGHIRFYDNRFGPFRGAPHDEVLTRLEDFRSTLQQKLATWDGRITVAEEAKPARLNPIVEGLAEVYATWLRIHPFADGNGRTARVLANWIASRYWQPPVLPGRPVADGDQLRRATSPAVPEATADYRPLTLHLRRRLKEARAAAAARQQM